MPVTAAIKFKQGATEAGPGIALIGDLGAPDVVAGNGDNSNVAIWTWEMIDVPPTSAVPLGILATGTVPTISFTPDQRGGYHLQLTIQDLAGNIAIDRRVFQVLEASGRLIPPFNAKAEALNFGGQDRGWAVYMEEWLHFLDTFASGGSVGVTNGNDGIGGPFTSLKINGTRASADDAGGGVANINIRPDVATLTVASSPFVVGYKTGQIFCDTTGGAITCFLPAPPAELGEEHIFVDWMGTAAANNITIDASGNTINGALTYVLNVNNQSVTVAWNGERWNIVASA